MVKEDYNLLMENIIERIGDTRPKLALHACCAPCACGVIGRLTAFDYTLIYYNPNIDTADEYYLRAKELEKLDAKRVVFEYKPEEYTSAVCGLEQEKEGGKRCYECIKLRLEFVAKYASENGYEWFSSTLSISPHKNVQLINNIGMELGKKYGVKFLPNDFKKRNGYINSVAISKQLDLYRQQYCGCKFAK